MHMWGKLAVGIAPPSKNGTKTGPVMAAGRGKSESRGRAGPLSCSPLGESKDLLTKCTPFVLFVKRFEESLEGVHP